MTTTEANTTTNDAIAAAIELMTPTQVKTVLTDTYCVFALRFIPAHFEVCPSGHINLVPTQEITDMVILRHTRESTSGPIYGMMPHLGSSSRTSQLQEEWCAVTKTLYYWWTKRSMDQALI
jgi:hypothetical protein